MNREYRITNIGIINDICSRRKKLSNWLRILINGGRNFLITIETARERGKIELAPSATPLVFVSFHEVDSSPVKIHREYVNHVFEHKSDWLNAFDASVYVTSLIAWTKLESCLPLPFSKPLHDRKLPRNGRIKLENQIEG